MRGIFLGLPVELEEAARMDGCSVFRTWKDVMAPLAKNGMIIVLVFSFYNIWGNIPWERHWLPRTALCPLR
nr:ABC transporter permease subunit [Enterocloster clostridioformis]